jgi:hypothetical protein
MEPCLKFLAAGIRKGDTTQGNISISFFGDIIFPGSLTSSYQNSQL